MLCYKTWLSCVKRVWRRSQAFLDPKTKKFNSILIWYIACFLFCLLGAYTKISVQKKNFLKPEWYYQWWWWWLDFFLFVSGFHSLFRYLREKKRTRIFSFPTDFKSENLIDFINIFLHYIRFCDQKNIPVFFVFYSTSRKYFE